MWTRSELKSRAKECLKRYYWAAFAVSLIFCIVSGFGGGNGNSGSSGNNSGSSISDEFVLPEPMAGLTDEIPEGMAENIGGIIGSTPIGNSFSSMKWGGLVLGVFAGVMIVMVIVGIILSIFVVPVLEVGKNRFYMESRLIGQSAGVGRILWGFSNRYLNIVLTRFLEELFITLGTFCCVIPGIYLAYCYRMVPYILAENPEMKPMEALRLSKQMMDGHKFNTFLLDLSFLGWVFLGMMVCCVGSFFVQPYVDATNAELYAVLRQPYAGGLNGFGYPDVVASGSFGGRYVNPDGVYDAGGYGNAGGYNNADGYGNAGGYNNAGPAYGGGNGYDQNNGGWIQPGQQSGNDERDASAQETRETNVSRSEGGPGRGYYLNGEFHPYTDDDK